jgi:hypothetical protein
MIDPVEQQSSVSRWQRLVLPSSMLGETGSRRSVRDWVVDVAMFALALGIGTIVLGETWSNHHGVEAAIDIVLGVLAAVSLWWRRKHPVGVAVFAGVLSLISALANGAGAVAFFNAALRTRAERLPHSSAWRS